jgi:hypothetical protein
MLCAYYDKSNDSSWLFDKQGGTN